MKLLDRIGSNWRDAGRDVVLIVVSILIAFSVDAWWGRTLDRRADEAEARALRDELAAGRESLASTLAGLERAAAATDDVLALMGPSAPAPGVEELFPLMGQSLNLGFRELRSSVVREVLTARNPLLSEDSTLMRQLDEWVLGAEDLVLDAGHLERNRDVDLQGALIGVGFPGIAVVGAQYLDLPTPTFPLETGALVRSSEVYAVFYYRAFRIELVRSSVSSLAALTDSVLVRLDGRLGASAR